MIDWEEWPAYERPKDDQLAWPLLNGTWPVDTPSRVLGAPEEEDDEQAQEPRGRSGRAAPERGDQQAVSQLRPEARPEGR